MKKLVLGLLGCVMLFTSCDPDVPGEGITLPEMNFEFKVSPDTAYIKLGDTITISSSIPSTLSNGVKITDGKAVINTSIGFSNETPIESISFKEATLDEYMYVSVLDGDINLTSSNSILDIVAIPNGDSIKTKLKIVPMKIGTYGIQLYSKFFEGSQGKTRTQSYFGMEDTHWDLYQISEHPGPNPGEEGYNKSYWFAVYE